MTISIEVENIKCGGCANSITKKLEQIEGVKQVNVLIEEGRVICATEFVNDEIQAAICAQLLSMGYPQKGSVEGLKAAGAKAKSMVSCAVGKIHSTD